MVVFYLLAIGYKSMNEWMPVFSFCTKPFEFQISCLDQKSTRTELNQTLVKATRQYCLKKTFKHTVQLKLLYKMYRLLRINWICPIAIYRMIKLKNFMYGSLHKYLIFDISKDCLNFSSFFLPDARLIRWSSFPKFRKESSLLRFLKKLKFFGFWKRCRFASLLHTCSQNSFQYYYGCLSLRCRRQVGLHSVNETNGIICKSYDGSIIGFACIESSVFYTIFVINFGKFRERKNY